MISNAIKFHLSVRELHDIVSVSKWTQVWSWSWHLFEETISFNIFLWLCQHRSSLKAIVYKNHATVGKNFWYLGHKNNHAEEATIWISSWWKHQKSLLGAWPLSLCWILKTERVKLPYSVLHFFVEVHALNIIHVMYIVPLVYFKDHDISLSIMSCILERCHFIFSDHLAMPPLPQCTIK